MIAIINYNGGNTASVANALRKFGYDYEITDDPYKILTADKVIFPGQGRAKPAMEDIKNKGLNMVMKQIQVPFLGICLGMQLLLPFSEEDNTKCLNIIEGKVKKFKGNDIKIPQIGWNTLKQTQKSPLLKDIPDNSYVYFVNSYYVETDTQYTIATTKYGNAKAVSIIQKDNFYGTQFHPEKSAGIGMKILQNFLEI